MSRDATRLVDPFRCRMWDQHDRLEVHITEESCKAEIESFERHGQIVAALGRKLVNDRDYDYELVYGARRLFIARHLNRPLLIEVRSMTDRDAIVAMDIENRHRQDISPYERGLSYANWLRAGKFASQDDIAKCLKISASQVSRLLKLARLPSVVVDAFSSATQICEIWGIEIAEALEDPLRRPAILRAARVLSAKVPRESGEKVYKELLFSSHLSRKTKKVTHDEVVLDEAGCPLFRVRYQRNSVALVLPLAKTSAASLVRIRQAVGQLMQTENDSCAVTEAPGTLSQLQTAHRSELLAEEARGGP